MLTMKEWKTITRSLQRHRMALVKEITTPTRDVSETVEFWDRVIHRRPAQETVTPRERLGALLLDLALLETEADEIYENLRRAFGTAAWALEREHMWPDIYQDVQDNLEQIALLSEDLKRFISRFRPLAGNLESLADPRDIQTRVNTFDDDIAQLRQLCREHGSWEEIGKWLR